jgi:tripartite-type tricarboxylate transporter receptor subunit TctC
MNRRHLFAAALSLPATTGAARAQGRPLRLVVPYAPGGGVDGQARALAGPLGAALSRNVVVDNKPGGSTRVGTDDVRRAAPDGDALLLMPAIAWIGFVASSGFDYEPWKVLVPVAQTAETPYNFFQTKAGSGLDTWEKLRAQALRTPGGLKVGGPSAGGIIEYTVEDLFRRGGITGVYAPFNGSGPAHAALLAGTVDLQLLPFGDGMGNVASGATHPIAVSSAARHAKAPEVPTFAELGIGETLSNVFSLWAPPNTPPETIATLANGIRAAIADPGFRTSMEDRQAFTVGFKDGATIRADLAAIERDWMPRLRAAR